VRAQQPLELDVLEQLGVRRGVVERIEEALRLLPARADAQRGEHPAELLLEHRARRVLVPLAQQRHAPAHLVRELVEQRAELGR